MEEMNMCSSFHGLHYWLIPAVLFTLSYSFWGARKNAADRKIHLPLALKLLSTHSDRWSFALLFGALFSIFLERLIGPEVVYCLYARVSPWAAGVIQVVTALEVSLVHYPIFVCLTLENSLLGNLLGFVYTVALFIYQIVMTAPSPPATRGDAYGDPYRFLGPVLLPTTRWYHIAPFLLCAALLAFRFLFIFSKLTLRRLSGQQQEENGRPVALAHHIEYVKRLLRPGKPLEKKNWCQRQLYERDPCFRFPARMLIMVAMGLTGVYRIGFTLTVLVVALAGIVPYPDIAWLHGFFTAVTVLGTIYHICQIMVQYRAQIRRLYKGDRKDLPRKLPATDVTMTRSMSYVGLQLAYLLLGMMILYQCVTVAGSLIIYPFVIGMRGFFVLPALIVLVPALLTLLVAFLLRRFVVRRFFLQDKLATTEPEKPLACKNIQALDSACYFTLLFFSIKAVFEFAFQLLTRFILACVYLARIDYTVHPLNPGGVLDSAYLTWLSMLLVDSAHTNPATLSFCHFLVQSGQSDPEVDTKLKVTASTVVGARRRWWLAYTLLRNPGLVALRRQGGDPPVTPSAPPASKMELELYP